MENKEEKKKSSKLGCLYLVLICIILGSCMFGGDDEKEESTKSVSTVQNSETKETESVAKTKKAKPVVKKTPEQIAQEKYDEWFTSLFSPWDGAFRIGEKYIKENMNDPDSYEHVESTYCIYPNFPDGVSEMLREKRYKKLKKGDFLVIMKFRGNNAFGGKVLDNQIFLCYYNGYDVGPTYYVIPKGY